MFQYGERNLKEYSNGTNAFNYILFLIEILNLIKHYKLKEPIVILDELEISLHNVMVDAQEVQVFLSTHSSRCVKDILEEDLDCMIYHIALKKHYSKAKRVKNLSKHEFRERVVISESYTNTCFSKMLINVEGETELKEIFPYLKNLEIVKGMSNQTISNLVAPNRRNYQTPCISLIDMDKLLTWKDGNRFEFKVPKDWNKEKEGYYYGKKRKNTLYLRFWYYLPLYSCEDLNYQELLEGIRTYCGNYNYFVWKTTIEGALITEENLEMFEEFATKTKVIPKKLKDVSGYLDTRVIFF